MWEISVLDVMVTSVDTFETIHGFLLFRKLQWLLNTTSRLLPLTSATQQPNSSEKIQWKLILTCLNLLSYFNLTMEYSFVLKLIAFLLKITFHLQLFLSSIKRVDSRFALLRSSTWKATEAFFLPFSFFFSVLRDKSKLT